MEPSIEEQALALCRKNEGDSSDETIRPAAKALLERIEARQALLERLRQEARWEWRL